MQARTKLLNNDCYEASVLANILHELMHDTETPVNFEPKSVSPLQKPERQTKPIYF